MQKLHIVLRTCDKFSLASDRIVPKDECVIRCLNSLVKSLGLFSKLEYTLTIIDDRSSPETIDKIKKLAPNANLILLGERDETGLNAKQKSRYSVKIAYDYIYSLPVDDLVYIIEDDYLHYPNSIEKMIEAYEYFITIFTESIVIFPQDFRKLYPYPDNIHKDTYVIPCYVVPGPDRYYRTTWFTHESFLIPIKTILQYKEHFESLLKIGDDLALWEGNTISNVWLQKDVRVLMPIMKTLTIHVSNHDDIPFYNTDFETLWEQNRY